MNEEKSLAHEFVARYNQLKGDHKTHKQAISILEGEFNFQIDDHTTIAPTYFFIDKSGCDFVKQEWQIYGFI
jgi:hypothetical protein